MARAWRVTQIPLSVTKDELRTQLDDSLEEGFSLEDVKSEKILQLDPAPSTRGYASATVTLQCTPPARTKHGYRIDNSFLGITPLYDCRDASVDVIAVPGLGSHALGSFKSSESFEVWLCDFLPRDIPNIRVLLYGYDTRLVRSTSKSSISDLSKSFLEHVRTLRKGTSTGCRPIVFVGHSLGGLLIKEALALANSDRDDKQSIDFIRSSYGMLFFGVPNLGLRNSQLQTMVVGQPNAHLVRDLVVDKDSEPSSYLKELGWKFMECCKTQEPRYEIMSYYERRESPTVEVSSF